MIENEFSQRNGDLRTLQNRVNLIRDRLLVFFRKYSMNFWDAEELAQEAFCKLIKNNELADKHYPLSHLYAVAWSVLRDNQRRERSRRRSQHVEFDSDLINTLTAENICPVKYTEEDEQYRIFLHVLNTLTPKTRSVFLLNRYQGLTYTQIACEYNVSVSSIEKHMMKALARFEQALGKDSNNSSR